jgi:hypothetical protein
VVVAASQPGFRRHVARADCSPATRRPSRHHDHDHDRDGVGQTRDRLGPAPVGRTGC